MNATIDNPISDFPSLLSGNKSIKALIQQYIPQTGFFQFVNHSVQATNTVSVKTTTKQPNVNSWVSSFNQIEKLGLKLLDEVSTSWRTESVQYLSLMEEVHLMVATLQNVELTFKEKGLFGNNPELMARAKSITKIYSLIQERVVLKFSLLEAQEEIAKGNYVTLEKLLNPLPYDKAKS